MFLVFDVDNSLIDTWVFFGFTRNSLVSELDSMAKLSEKCNIQVPMEVLKWVIIFSSCSFMRELPLLKFSFDKVDSAYVV